MIEQLHRLQSVSQHRVSCQRRPETHDSKEILTLSVGKSETLLANREREWHVRGLSEQWAGRGRGRVVGLLIEAYAHSGLNSIYQ